MRSVKVQVTIEVSRKRVLLSYNALTYLNRTPNISKPYTKLNQKLPTTNQLFVLYH